MIYSTGKRKTSIAKVRLFLNSESAPGAKSQIEVNSKTSEDYFTVKRMRHSAHRPIKWILKLLNIRAQDGQIDKSQTHTMFARSFTDGELDSINAFSIEESKRIANQLQNETNFKVSVSGGGVSSQAEAVMYGVSKTIIQLVPELKNALRALGLATRDSRIVERKIPGKRKSRKSEQYSKR